jgi:hypothetical protein
MLDGEAKWRTGMLTEPALMVSGTACTSSTTPPTRRWRQRQLRLTDFEISDFDVVFPTQDVAVASYRVRQSMQRRASRSPRKCSIPRPGCGWRGDWKCVAHTEAARARA